MQLTSSVQFAGKPFILDARGALYWPSQQLLLVSDLHLEKGSYFANRGQPLPVWDTRDTLDRLAALIKAYTPHKVMALGDNMHDAFALMRMLPQDFSQLEDICQSVPEWYWIIGNHDKGDYTTSIMKHHMFYTDVVFENILFSHEFHLDVPFQIIGHFHPKVKIKTGIQSISGKGFVVAEKTLLMPAFGSYTGGLLVDHPAIQRLFMAEKQKHYMLYQTKIWRVK